ncbi:MAG: metallophosphoesterase [Clostridiales bacterium]|nr:metallophosphoesterase [Clostridiales bacterium]
MKYIASDIHGEYDLFMRLLEKISFSDKDEFFVCGDIVEKGVDSVKLVRRLMKMPNVKCILGNHEYAFLKYYWSIMECSPTDFDGVLDKLRENFSGGDALLDFDVVDYLEALPFYIETNDFICVHAGVPKAIDGSILPLENASAEQLVYDRTFKDPAVTTSISSKCVFFGHTPTIALTGGRAEILTYLKPNRQGKSVSDYYKIHLDLGTPITGRLGCFCVETCTPHYVDRFR